MSSSGDSGEPSANALSRTGIPYSPSRFTTELLVSEPQTPAWVRDAVFYQIFPDRFARSLAVPKPSHLDEWGSPPTYHGYQGGDLIGVVERLDYLSELGVNALYFTPVFQSA